MVWTRPCGNINNSKTLSAQYDSWWEFGRYLDSFELSVYRIVQELLNNIIRHSKATQAIVQISQQNSLLSITIEDNGVDFQSNSKKDGWDSRALSQG
jgi:signal transduction histidine kinase